MLLEPYLPPRRRRLGYWGRGGIGADGRDTLGMQGSAQLEGDSDRSPTGACWTRIWALSALRAAGCTASPDGPRGVAAAGLRTESRPLQPQRLGLQGTVQTWCRQVVGLEDANLTARTPRPVCYPYNLWYNCFPVLPTFLFIVYVPQIWRVPD